MSQTWSDLLFAHWTVPAAALRSRLPPGLALDTFSGDAWIGIVPFRMSNVAPRMPVRGCRLAFPELNVRTYVVADGKPGVWFFSLDAASPLAVSVARTVFHLPYFWARMQIRRRDGWVDFASQRLRAGPQRARFGGRYRPTGQVFRSQPGSLDSWLTERYCLYAADRAGRLLRGEINHAPWPLQPAEAELDVDGLAASHGLTLSGAPLLHFARRINMVAWWPVRLDLP
jgi:hypothetical protein